ncbi:MAG TPA: Asp-tRNA(Asn)/Glu-tRNA(Gln) amidotransferase GatCAB subunit A [Dehalococcoidia bacterium]|nr:Asp-tRNA(Asn)/Glu-tRNA(Gln) amidotransferase GatCAB subunit A [Dehalococcoidia bacterium]
MADLWELNISDAFDGLHKKDFSSVELTESCLGRVNSTETKIQSFITITENVARNSAKEADLQIQQGSTEFLTGIPMQLKDLLCTKGIETTCGSQMLKGFIPAYNATVVEKLNSVKAVTIGKGNMDEFAMGSSCENSAFHPTFNPWDLTRVPGGSSGGAAASVAAGQVLFSIGSDTGGSIRQPAALCGVVGLKPTYGLVSRYGLIAFASSLDQIGPITKTVKDNAIVLDSIMGHDSHDATSLTGFTNKLTPQITGNVKGLKIGIPKEYFVDGIDPAVKTSVLEAVKVLESLGAEIIEISLPHTEYALSCYYIIAPSECSSNLARYDGVKYGHSFLDTDDMWEAMRLSRAQGFGTEVKRRMMIGTYALSSGYYDAYYLKAQKVRTIIKQEFEETFKIIDAIVCPTTPSVAFGVGEKMLDPMAMYMNDICTIPANMAGLPGLSVPCGMSGGLPIGMQIVGPRLSEKTLYDIGYAFEQHTEWHRQRPEL